MIGNDSSLKTYVFTTYEFQNIIFLEVWMCINIYKKYMYAYNTSTPKGRRGSDDVCITHTHTHHFASHIYYSFYVPYVLLLYPCTTTYQPMYCCFNCQNFMFMSLAKVQCFCFILFTHTHIYPYG